MKEWTKEREKERKRERERERGGERERERERAGKRVRSSTIHGSRLLYSSRLPTSVTGTEKLTGRNLLRPNCLVWNEVAEDRARSWTIKFERWLAGRLVNERWKFRHESLNKQTNKPTNGEDKLSSYLAFEIFVRQCNASWSDHAKTGADPPISSTAGICLRKFVPKCFRCLLG